MKPVVILSIVLGLSAAGAGGWFYYTGQLAEWVGMNEASANIASEDAGEPSEEAPLPVSPSAAPIYLKMDPPFLVNFEMDGSLRFLQVSLEVMAREPAAIQSAQTHMPYVRNNILLLLSDQSLDTIMSADAKEALREEILKEIQFVLTQVTGTPGIEAVYFTSFVMQ